MDVCMPDRKGTYAKLYWPCLSLYMASVIGAVTGYAIGDWVFTVICSLTMIATAIPTMGLHIYGKVKGYGC